MRFSLTLFALLISGAVAAAAEEVPVVVSPAAQDLAVSIYTDALALVRETRTVALPEGPAVVEFRGVSDSIVPQAAVVEGLAGIVERNFDYDVLTPYALLRKSVGETVTLVRTNPGSGARTRERARVVSGEQGITLDFGDDRVEAVDCAGLPEGLGFDRLPEGLRTEPTLSARIRSERAGEQTLTLFYLVHGISWSADYNVTLDPGTETFDLEAWLTIANYGGTSFREAETAVVAGTLNQDHGSGWFLPVDRFVLSCWQWGRRWPAPDPDLRIRADFQPVQDVASAISGGIEEIVVTASRREALTEAQREELLDYHFYRVPWRTTVAANESKQVRFLSKRGIRGEWYYAVGFWSEDSGSEESVAAEMALRFENDEENHLGEPLPRGTLRVVQVGADGVPLYLGEGPIRDAAVDTPVEVALGPSSRVFSRHRVLEESQRPLLLRSLFRGKPFFQTTRDRAITITNAREADAIVEVRELTEYAETRVSRSSHPWKRDRGIPTWRLEIPAGGDVTLRYRSRVIESE